MSNDRPSMQQDDHPEHNMPVPEHDGTELPYGSLSDRINDAENKTLPNNNNLSGDQYGQMVHGLISKGLNSNRK